MVGIVTDGDLRRMLESGKAIDSLTAQDIMTATPKSISGDMLAVKALQKMQKNNITQLIVCDNDTYSGVIHLHDLLKEGIV